MNRGDYLELEELIADDMAMSDKVYRVHSRMIKMCQVFNDSYDTEEFFENNSFGGDRSNTIPEEYRLNKTITDIYSALEDMNLVDDYDPLICDLVEKVNSRKMDVRTAKLQLISIGASVGIMTNFYTAFDEYLDKILRKEREKNKELKITK